MLSTRCHRSFAFALAVFVLTPFSSSALAESPFQASIGNAVVELTGPWRFHPGDDLAWAQPGYDDSAWATQDLTPPAGSLDPVTGISGFVPGWTTKGFPKLTGYAWYRLRVNVVGSSGSEVPPLAIRLPMDVDDAYQVYVNGQYIGEFGTFTPKGVTFINAQPRAFALPASLRSGPIVIAIRFWMDAGTPLISVDAGGLHGVPLLGQAENINSMLQMAWYEIDRSQVTYMVRVPLLGLLALLGLILFWLDRREKAYLWLAVACAIYMLDMTVIVSGYYTTWMPMVSENFLIDVVVNPLIFGLWVIFWGAWFSLPEMRRIHQIVWSLFFLLFASIAMLRAPLYGSVIPVSASSWLLPLTEVLKFAFGAVILWIVYRGIRLRGIEGWLALLPILLMPIWLYQDELTTIHLYRVFNILGLPVGPNFVAIILTLAAICVLMMRRFIRGLREKQQLQTEMEQARQVQQLLVPEKIPSIPGFAIESEYRPAQQVGGDFFQVLTAENGGVLAVIGDVSGKGMPAAMTVGLLVGAIRTLAEITSDPAEIVRGLNRRLCGRVEGQFATCLVLHIDASGEATFANAGHLPPYRNGSEMELAGCLPLGLDPNTEFSTVHAFLHPGESLVLLTDGVVEARDAAGHLFGFDETARLTRENRSAIEIAAAAQQFGQQDDITVLRIQRIRPDAASESVLSVRLAGLAAEIASAPS
jgi:hypothetical protein